MAKRVFSFVYIVMIVLFLGYFFSSNRETLPLYLGRMHAAFLLPALLAGLFFFTVAGTLWMFLQRQAQTVSIKISLPNWLRIFMAGYLGRYIPGKVAIMIGRMLYLTRYGYSRGAVVMTSLYEFLLMIGSALLVAATVLLVYPGAWAGKLHGEAVAFLCGAMLIIVIVVSPLFRQLLALVAEKRPPEKNVRFMPLTGGKAGLFFILYALLGVAGGMVFLLFINTLTPFPLTLPNLLIATAIINLAGAAGMLAVFAPGGLGVREGVIVLFLTAMPGMKMDLAILVSVSYRLFLTVVELLFFLAVCTISSGPGSSGHEEKDEEAGQLRLNGTRPS